jgi:hypothetical protein
MAGADTAGSHPEHLAGDHPAAVQHHQPVDRAHELDRTLAPAHALWCRQGDYCLLDTLWNQRTGTITGFHSAMYQPATLVCFQFLKHVDRHSAGAGKTDRCRGCCAAAIKGSSKGWAAALLHSVRAAASHSREPRSQTPWCGKPGSRPSWGQTLISQRDRQQFGKGLCQALECPGRQLLGADLDQQVRPPGLCLVDSFAAAARKAQSLATLVISPRYGPRQ